MDQNQVLLQQDSVFLLLDRIFIRDLIFHTSLDLREDKLISQHVCDTLLTTKGELLPGVLCKSSEHLGHI